MQRIPAPPTIKGSADWFTGDVYVDPITQGRSSDPLSVASVHFCPGGHTAWHHHTIGQTLYVTDGVGYVQSRGGPLLTIRPGDVIRIEGGEEHWHGAGTSNLMTHLAITEGDTVWGEHLTDDEYPSAHPGSDGDDGSAGESAGGRAS